jgi:hypothetical protein
MKPLKDQKTENHIGDSILAPNTRWSFGAILPSALTDILNGLSHFSMTVMIVFKYV